MGGRAPARSGWPGLQSGSIGASDLGAFPKIDNERDIILRGASGLPTLDSGFRQNDPFGSTCTNTELVLESEESEAQGPDLRLDNYPRFTFHHFADESAMLTHR
jgi:hypothetical protein